MINQIVKNTQDGIFLRPSVSAHIVSANVIGQKKRTGAPLRYARVFFLIAKIELGIIAARLPETRDNRALNSRPACRTRRAASRGVLVYAPHNVVEFLVDFFACPAETYCVLGISDPMSQPARI